ncbi:beta-glucosidase family protein [Spirochaeta cellobiosiphila]|uniref:beta-glucosidase family protein n=1 Tax=Spirochaeta cellobiosiphila TaxID=504483 RepID=UPI0003F94F04|nr:glycoside hydrolase family 3 C-terminal domain-containing protein [Spirochaeta cellobiosiphila]
MSNLKYQHIIKKMTLEQKASLMSGKDFWQTQDILSLGIPSIFLADGPHGIRKQAVSSSQMGFNQGIPATCFPTEATVANSWNIELSEAVGSYLGKEAVSQNVHVLLGPGINMKRSPLCGRNFEYFSEDPYLAGKLAASYIRGVQTHGISACVKHYCAKNQEERSMSLNTIVDERALREIYLTAFEIAVKEGKTKAIMSSYNKLNGEYTNENLHIMVNILRDEWEYDGCVITDWGGSSDRVKGIKAGNELEMPSSGGETDRQIIDAIKSNELAEEQLDECVDRVLDLVLKTSQIGKTPSMPFDVAKHHRISQKMAEESIVLLKNKDDILPIKYNKKVAVIGDFAKEARYQGSGSSQVNPTILENTLECFAESGITSIGYAQGFLRNGKTQKKLVKTACELAQKADVVLLYLGLDELSEVQGLDRKDMRLPSNQIELLNTLYKVNENIVVCLSSGSAIEMPWIIKVKGLLHGYLSGQAGARALLRIISGDVNPSGKLAETYPYRYEDTPTYNHFPGKEASVEYRESVYIGYRYYDTANVNVLFPFGFGLSYTSYEYSDLKVNSEGVTFKITNTGSVPGMEIAQLYIHCQSKAIFRPYKELKGFKKVFINPGETKEITISFDDKSFRYFDIENNSWEVEESSYDILIGSSSQDIKLTDSLFITGTSKQQTYTNHSLKHYQSGQIQNVPSHEFEQLLGYPLPSPLWDRNRPLDYNDSIAQCIYAKGLVIRISFRFFQLIMWLLERTGQRKAYNFLKVSVYNMPFRALSLLTGGKISFQTVDGILLIANGHFFKGIGTILKKKQKGRNDV